MTSTSESKNGEDVDKAILWASTFLCYEGARITSERPAVIGGARSRRAEREAQKAGRIRLLFTSCTASTTAAVAVRRAREGVQAAIVQDFKDKGQSATDDQMSEYSPQSQHLSNDTTGFLLKYALTPLIFSGVAGITPSIHATYLQNLFQRMYRNETPLPEDRSALSHYIYCFSINRIWQCLQDSPGGSKNPFIALFLSWESASELTESDFRGRSPNQGSIPRDLEREDESKLSEYVGDLPDVKSTRKPLQFELTEGQAWQLLTKFKSCLGRIQSTASMIKTLVQGHQDPEKHSVKVNDRLLLTGAVKLLAANFQVLGWLVHHSSSFWKLLDSLEPVFAKRMVKPSLIGTTGGCCFCCSRLLELSRIKSTNLSAELPIQPWMPPNAIPMDLKLQILDDLVGLLEEYLGTRPREERKRFRPRQVKEEEEKSQERI
ncbi:hypothetical protein M407DRAFT_227330 [Tulasnella calospora MUT 4182]|uniref:Uncharacterized protein n=1 Tax=Tulasnella calospora MUT 4182 TaxID=1051891 RepID=A0A0C3QQ26_9AGAM|nr:hypothetical protein M407DRAFT_227330 [Tulasnella calospora MUT 4182]